MGAEVGSSADPRLNPKLDAGLHLGSALHRSRPLLLRSLLALHQERRRPRLFHRPTDRRWQRYPSVRRTVLVKEESGGRNVAGGVGEGLWGCGMVTEGGREVGGKGSK